jgi:hypothetical protein
MNQSTRYFFAGLAMQVIYQRWIDNNWDVLEHQEILESIAQEAFLIADAMMEQGELK